MHYQGDDDNDNNNNNNNMKMLWSCDKILTQLVLRAKISIQFFCCPLNFYVP